MAFNISQLGNTPEVPGYVANQISLMGDSQRGSNIFFYLGIGLVIIVFLIIIVYVYRKQKSKSGNSSKSPFDESFEKGINFLNSKDFKSARVEYYNMKSIAEKSGDKKTIDKTLDFYKKYEGALNEKK